MVCLDEEVFNAACIRGWYFRRFCEVNLTPQILLPGRYAESALNLLSPVRIFGWTLGLFLIGLVLAPIQPVVGVSLGAMFCWGAVYVMAMAGAALASPSIHISGNLKFEVVPFPARKLANRCIAIGAIGVVLSAFDRYVVRGAPLGFDILVAREVLTDAGSGMLGLIAAAASSFAPLGLLCAWLARAMGQPLPRRIEFAALASLTVYMLFSIALGSRSLVVVCVLLHVVAAIFFQVLKTGRVNWRGFAAALFVVFILIVGSAWLMLARLDQMGLSPITSIQLSGYAYTLQPSDSLVDTLNASDQLGYFGAALYSLLLYTYHGFYEFSLLYDNFNGFLLLGEKHLWLPLKILSVLTGYDYSTDLSQINGFRDGVYTTMAGPMYLDFGWFAPVFSFYLFFGLTYPFKRVAMGDWRWFVAAAQVAVIIIMAPVISLMDSSVGVFPLLAALALPLLAGRPSGITSSHRANFRDSST
jgi:hypothetical protein